MWWHGCSHSDGVQVWAFGHHPNALLQQRRAVVKPPLATRVLLPSQSGRGVAVLLFGRVCLFIFLHEKCCSHVGIGAEGPRLSRSCRRGYFWERDVRQELALVAFYWKFINRYGRMQA